VAQAVIGLGNPGAEYRDTRHNVGQRVLDILAARLATSFAPWPAGGSIHQLATARRTRDDDAHYLLKPGVFMNASGPAVAAATRALALEPADLVVVFDDLDLPLGTVRARRAGSSGGHHGVQSILEALGTSEIRRVKVGIGRPLAPGEPRAQVVDHVLSHFAPEESAAVGEACDAAAGRVLELLARRDARA